MAEDQRLLAGVKAGEHLPQGAGATDTGEHRPNVGFVVQEASNPGPHLAHDLVVDAAGALVHDEKGDVVLTQLAGDVAEDGVARDLRVQELVSLLDDDHQGPWFVALVAGREILLLDIALVDATGEVVGDQDVGGQGVAIGAELEHHADALAQAVKDAIHNVLALARDEEVHPPEQLKLALYGA